MNLTIIGTGNIGKKPGSKWAQSGHQVRYALCNPADPKHTG
jgi:predicted dinucleotide-binding enzyme